MAITSLVYKPSNSCMCQTLCCVNSSSCHKAWWDLFSKHMLSDSHKPLRGKQETNWTNVSAHTNSSRTTPSEHIADSVPPSLRWLPAAPETFHSDEKREGEREDRREKTTTCPQKCLSETDGGFFQTRLTACNLGDVLKRRRRAWAVLHKHWGLLSESPDPVRCRITYPGQVQIVAQIVCGKEWSGSCLANEA